MSNSIVGACDSCYINEGAVQAERAYNGHTITVDLCPACFRRLDREGIISAVNSINPKTGKAFSRQAIRAMRSRVLK